MPYSFTNRTGGVSLGAFASLNLATHVDDDLESVLQNRKILEAAHGPIQFMNQVHGNRIVIIEEVGQESPTADALVTGIPGVALAVMVADCIPLLISSNEVVAAVHVGRRGLLNSVTSLTIALMREMGASAMTAIIGPAICGSCYEVSPEIFAEVTNAYPSAISRTPHGSPALDLPAALRQILKEEGISSIIDESSCTVEDQNLFSYRRDGVTGRQVGLISL